MSRNSRGARLLGAIALLGVPFTTSCLGDAGAGATWNGPAFSADMVNLRDSTKAPTRIFVDAGKLRMESLDPGNHIALVLDPAHSTTLLITEKDRTYIDAGRFASAITVAFGPLLHFLRPGNPTDPCTEWNATVNRYSGFMQQQKSGPPPHFTCQSQGQENVNGRPAQKWMVSTTDNSGANSTSTVWIDERLHVISKSTDSNGQMELRNIHDGPQSADLFVPPPGYRKLGITEILGSLRKATGTSSSP